MRFTSSAGSGQYRRFGPIIFDDDIVGVIDGKYVVGSVGRKSVTAVRQEKRKSFKHPIGGLIVGLIMVLFPLQSALGNPFGVGLALTSPSRGIGGAFMLLFGLYLLWGVVTRKDEPWIVFVLRQGERAFPLKTELSPDEAAKLLQLITADPAIAAAPLIERALGFEVLPAKPPASKESPK